MAHNDSEPYDAVTLRAIDAAWGSGTADGDLRQPADDVTDAEVDTFALNSNPVGRVWIIYSAADKFSGYSPPSRGDRRDTL